LRQVIFTGLFWSQLYTISVEIETNGSLMQGQDYKVDASKLSNRVLSIFDKSSQMCAVWRCRDGRRRLSYWSILVTFSRLLGIIFPINSRDYNQLFDRAAATRSERFLSNSTTHTASPKLCDIRAIYRENTKKFFP